MYRTKREVITQTMVRIEIIRMEKRKERKGEQTKLESRIIKRWGREIVKSLATLLKEQRKNRRFFTNGSLKQ